MNQQNIVPVGNEFSVTYDYANGWHNVYVGLGGQLRRISFPTKENAHDFLTSVAQYRNVKEEI